jgi:hypothetical protein
VQIPEVAGAIVNKELFFSLSTSRTAPRFHLHLSHREHEAGFHVPETHARFFPCKVPLPLARFSVGLSFFLLISYIREIAIF